MHSFSSKIGVQILDFFKIDPDLSFFQGRYVTIQLVDATPSTKLKIKHIAVELATVDC